MFLGLRFFPPFFLFSFAWWPPLLFLVRIFYIESGRGNKRARVTRGSRNPRHSKRNINYFFVAVSEY
jgi:hypothetical protein